MQEPIVPACFRTWRLEGSISLYTMFLPSLALASIIHSWADCCFRNVLVKSTILYIWQICLKDFFLDREGIGSAFRSGLTEWGVGCSWDQMNTVLEKLSSSARELSYYHSGEGPLLFLSLCGGAFASLWCWLVGFRGFILMTLLNPFLIWVPLASLNQYPVTSSSMDLAMQKMGFLSLLPICNPTLAKIKHIQSNCVTGSRNSLMWSVSNVLLL